MTQLVDDLLDVARISQGKVTLKRQLVDAREVVRNAVEISAPLIDSMHHRMELRLPDRATLVDADPVRLAQCVSNLLNNAAKYTPEGGQLWLTARAEDGQAVISVRDTGVGIEPEMLARVFELFVQVEKSLHRSDGGLGIGLTLARRLVEMHDGSLEARSDGPGHGSEFIVRLPLAETGSAPARIPGLVNAGTSDSGGD
jgi:signal transduction histidine kinase